MASRPEPAYAATEVTPKWVLISWHHLLPPSLIIAAHPTRRQWLVTVPDRTSPHTHAHPLRRRPRNCRRDPGRVRAAPRHRGTRARRDPVLRDRYRGRLLRDGLGRRSCRT